MRRCLAATLVLACVAGCPPPARRMGDPIPIHQAIAIANANTAQVTTCLKAEGSAAGYFTLADGGRHHFDFRAVLFVTTPRHLYLTLKSGLGTQELLIGSNEEQYWLHVKRDDDTYRFGTHAALGNDLESFLPLRPDMVIEALGLNGLPETTAGASGPVQRIVDEHQQLIFLSFTSTGQGIIRKEYWLDRYEPRLIRRILFRDGMGRVIMDSCLDDCKAMGGDGPLVARRIRIEWPLDGGMIDFRIRRWEPRPERGLDHPAFVAPHERGLKFTHMIDLDADGSVE
ncbi:MAG: hypothetical protein ACYSVY_23325 [Planctomycetota bacterium]